MDSVLEKYNSFEYEECLNLLTAEVEKQDTLVNNFIKQNCMNVCKCLLIIEKEETETISQMQITLYKLYQNIVAVALPGTLVPIEVELAALFNFMWWTVYYTDFSDSHKLNSKGFLAAIQRGIRRGESFLYCLWCTVLGLCSKSRNYDNIAEDILYDLKETKKNFKNGNYNTVLLFTEVVVLILLFMLTIDNSMFFVKQCSETVNTVLSDMDMLIKGQEAVKEFQNFSTLSTHELLFKFSFLKLNETVSNPNTSALDCLHVTALLCLLMSNKHEGVLMLLKKKLNATMKALWCYMGGLSALALGDLNQSLGFVLMTSELNTQGMLRSKTKILHGQVLSRFGNHKEALECYSEARNVSPNDAAPLYYMGEEHGKIGLNDEMVECFQALIKAKESHRMSHFIQFSSSFETIVLSILHPVDEICESEAFYAAAVACGLSDRFNESTQFFERFIQIFPVEEKQISNGERIIKVPSIITALHEAAAMCLLTGDIHRTECFLRNAADLYTPKINPKPPQANDVHVVKDCRWLQSLIQTELGLNLTVDDEESTATLFAEEMVYFFQEDVVAMMLTAEIEKIQDLDSYRSTLVKIISILSKYLAEMQTKENVDNEESLRWTLVKALSAKACLNIAEYQMKCKPSAEIERTFKRALSSNQGDKDVLHCYYKFLVKSGKANDAHRLWNTFRMKEPAVLADQCQSLALRYLLRSHVTKRDLENIDLEVETNAMDIDSVDNN